MKLEYIDHDLTPDEPYSLLRLYDIDDFDLMKLRHLIKRSLVDREGLLIISNLDFVDPLNCTLTFQLSIGDDGITATQNEGNDFIARLSRDGYLKMLDAIDALVSGANCLYQPREEGIKLLLVV